MCGVCARVSNVPLRAQEDVDVVNVLQEHRGPDGAKSALFDGTCLGNTRLAVMSPGKEGDQPLRAQDGSCTAVFNGEIYNHRELLHDYGLSPGGSDGAVIPQLFSRFGTGCFRLLRGMFAVVLLDHRTGQLVLARDQLGIKPLHWREDAGELRVASEIRPLMRPGDSIERSAVARFLHLGSLPVEGTPFAAVKAVPPNSWLVFRAGRLSERGVIEPDLDLAQGAGNHVSAALRESVALHLRSDVDTALLLSSGIDSSAIAWGAREAGKSLHCLTVDLGGGRREAKTAALTAVHYGHTHETVRHTPADEDIVDFFGAMQRPSIDGLNTFVVSRAVRDSGFKVALSGLGGDEATAAYAHFRYLRWLRYASAADRVPLATGLARHMLSRFSSSRKGAELLAKGARRDAWHVSLVQRQVWPRPAVEGAVGASNEDLVQERAVASGRTDAGALTAAEYRLYLQSTLLPDADAFSMASSVELRVPMVDRLFLAAAIQAGGPSGLGKRGFASAIGEPHICALARAPKQGFALPMDEWMRQGLLRGATEQAMSPTALVWDHVDRQNGKEVFLAWQAGQVPWSHAWALVVLDQWLRSLDRTSPAALESG